MSEKTLQYYGTGRRKSSAARVYLRPGSGNFVVNDRPFEEYFSLESHKHTIKQPLHLTETESKFDLFRWTDPPVAKLAQFCHLSLTETLRQLTTYSQEEFGRFRFDYHAWFHVTRRHGYQGQHNHPNASWSGIFCVDPGDVLPDRPDSGLVRFHEPIQAHPYQRDELFGPEAALYAVDDLDAADQPPVPIVPFAEVVQDRLGMEIMRGCTRGCRFCHAGMVTRPVRERPVSEVLASAEWRLVAMDLGEEAPQDLAVVLELVDPLQLGVLGHELVEGVGPDHGRAHLAGDPNHGDAVQFAVGQPGDQVGRPRAQGAQATRGLAGQAADGAWYPTELGRREARRTMEREETAR